MAQTKKQIANRGKYAEFIVQTYLDRLNEAVMNFSYDRQPDARAAGGRLKAALCDYLWWWEDNGLRDGSVTKVSGLLEVKETKHDYRLAKDKLDQLPRMRKIRRAGAVGIVLVYHTTIEKWRIADLSFFDGPIPPSWDLSKLPTYDSLSDAMESAVASPYFPKIYED